MADKRLTSELIAEAQKAERKYGVPTSVTLAFAGYETAYGTAGMGKSKNNLFGIGNKVYNSIAESVDDFARLVTGNKSSAQSKKYGTATAKATTNEEWVSAIRNAGYNSEYATGVYESNVLKMISSGDLNQYNVKADYTQGGDTTAGGASSPGYSSIQLGGGSFGENPETSPAPTLEWWGDIVIVVFCTILIIGGVVFVGLAVTNSKAGGIIAKVKDTVKEVADE